MSKTKIDKDQLNHEIRRFLKLVGITSQLEIEKAAKDALAAGTFPESGKFAARMTLSVPALNLEHVIDHELDVRQ
jgi:hypothetical protein